MKKDRLREMSMEIMVGAFMFIVLFILAVLTIALSRQNYFTKTYPMTVLFQEVQGLRDGDTVTSRGVKIGRVKGLEFSEEGVRVFLTLDQPLKLHEDYLVRIEAASVLGGQHLAIDTGSRDRPLLPEGTVVQGALPVDLVGSASATFEELRAALTDGGIIDNLKSTMEQLNHVTARLDRGEGSIGKLLTHDEVYTDLAKVTANLREVSQRLVDGQGTLAKLLSQDDTLYSDMQEITSNLKEVSDRLASGKGTLGKLLSEDDTLYTDLSESAASIRDISQTISEGKGTLGRLTKDDEIYEEARLLLQEIRAMVDDIRETSPITTFSSVFFGAF